MPRTSRAGVNDTLTGEQIAARLVKVMRSRAQPGATMDAWRKDQLAWLLQPTRPTMGFRGSPHRLRLRQPGQVDCLALDRVAIDPKIMLAHSLNSTVPRLLYGTVVHPRVARRCIVGVVVFQNLGPWTYTHVHAHVRRNHYFGWAVWWHVG